MCLLCCDFLDLAFWVFECHLENFIRAINQVWFKSRHEELRPWVMVPSHWVSVSVTESLDLLSYALAIQWVKSAVELVQDVERQRLYSLYGKYECSSDDCLLTSRQMSKWQSLMFQLWFLVFLRTDDLSLMLFHFLARKTDQNPNSFVHPISDS